ncbi:hypothetical protein KAR50_05780 [Periweissella fabaria]|uniref:Uncharacterized protein n=1 Tax=Periweissella fabaria TaxID=546157 RepID=A0ABN8BHP9_9LACO|nr:hypothetical protein [Periweissella fabaria]MCM0597352.1 hypothetical protein [Periweissella fabaria]CAH0416144.1 hypothetical protein WFA24289_00443 [Periweissella fabaria]
MTFTDQQIMDIISKNTAQVWDSKAESDLKNEFVRKLELSLAQPLTPKEHLLLNNTLPLILKRSTKNTLIATINTLIELGVISRDDQ